ncbi:Methyltransferase family protein [Elusimicrobium minutum Pei191]|uniref:Methyltransferase family protein n=1 Tax=Elusimicrobium minutum (strain Pei191) TaxID=445932 RepID=B2KBT3_ELUMP|nr:class I SAM-dependent methyltransferase [Elusimicrobium minutum]ACC97837.1 Methyltransferase family protein [Elusimicrobium minutum Pei191]
MTEKKTVKKETAKKAAAKKPADKKAKTVKTDSFIDLFELNKNDVLLDLGCGKGEFLKTAAKTTAFATGIDCSAEHLTEAQKALQKTGNITLIEGWLQDAWFENNSFTKITAKDVLRSMNNHEKGVLINKVSNWLKPGGLFIVQDIITSFGLHRKDERHEMIEAECKKYYGKKWPELKDSFYHDLYHAHPSDLSLMMHHFLFTGFNVLQIIKHTSCVCTIVAQK